MPLQKICSYFIRAIVKFRIPNDCQKYPNVLTTTKKQCNFLNEKINRRIITTFFMLRKTLLFSTTLYSLHRRRLLKGGLPFDGEESGILSQRYLLLSSVQHHYEKDNVINVSVSFLFFYFCCRIQDVAHGSVVCAMCQAPII